MNSSLRTLLAEGLGTFILVLFGCGAVHAAVLTGAHSELFAVSMVWGLGVVFAAFVAGGVSGAHINPAMTVALATWGRFPWSKVGPYIGVQVAGAFLAAGALYLIYGPSLLEKEREKGVKRGELGSIVTAMCYGEFYPNPAQLIQGGWGKKRSETALAYGSKVTITLAPSRAGTPVGAILTLLNDKGEVIMGVSGGGPGEAPRGGAPAPAGAAVKP